jgi:hypothetical protein
VLLEGRASIGFLFPLPSMVLVQIHSGRASIGFLFPLPDMVLVQIHSETQNLLNQAAPVQVRLLLKDMMAQHFLEVLLLIIMYFTYSYLYAIELIFKDSFCFTLCFFIIVLLVHLLL